MLCTSLNITSSTRHETVQAMTNSVFKSALTSGFHTESSKSRSREPSLDMLLLLLLRPALRLGSHWYGARWSRLAFLRRRFCCINSCKRSTLQRVARFSVWRTRSPREGKRERGGGHTGVSLCRSLKRMAVILCVFMRVLACRISRQEIKPYILADCTGTC